MQPQSQQQTRTQLTGFFSLPPELREEIYLLVLQKPHNTITMLANHTSYKSEISAAQPSLTKVCKQLRHETLPVYYNANVFLADVSEADDVATAQRWLRAIGDERVKELLDLKHCRIGHTGDQGSTTMTATEADALVHPRVAEASRKMREMFVDHFGALNCRKFTAEDLSAILSRFHNLCNNPC
ncbi:hypothetical protein LTR62_003345 [Meristemomyces frigidus]|uniref:2EXR domain-containing protein n=1 Tax=Meristemomyces frigidus TaxID=1508187 RepID=A0AAN7TPF6_9PEZI|nr:hypothetical protein LTR62_003345 [Meristemomyces frigidus]